MSSPDPGPLGEPGLSPAAFRELIGRVFARALEFVPEEHRSEAAEELARELDAVKAKPAQPGESIVFGGAAEQLMREALRDARSNAEPPLEP